MEQYKVNSPDPKNVRVEDELIKYELVELENKDFEHGISSSSGKAFFTENSDNVVGVMLVQIFDNETIKTEIFPGKTSSEVNSFTLNAKTYTR